MVHNPSLELQGGSTLTPVAEVVRCRSGSHTLRVAAPRTPILTLGDWFYNAHASAESSENLAIRAVALVIPQNEWRHENKFAACLLTLPLALVFGVIAALESHWSIRLPCALVLLFMAEWVREVIVARRRERNTKTGV